MPPSSVQQGVSPRLKGQETSVLLVQNNQPLISLFDIRSFESSELLAILTENYLGETTSRYDEIYNGFSFRLEAHLETSLYLAFRQSIVNKARRRAGANLQTNIKTTYNFPQARVRVTLRDVHFGEMPLNIPGREQYVTVALSGNGSAIAVN